MCGIAAVARARGEPIEDAELRRLGDALGHRGPDDRGAVLLEGGRLGLVATRLSIVDLQAGPQPYTNEDGSVIAVVNGEFYDHVELAQRLRRRGHTLRTRCDAELVVHLYEDHGLDFAAELDGDFALILWDARRQRLLACRDRMGVRPLYLHSRSDGQILLASEAKAFVAFGERLSLDPGYLCGHLLGAYNGRSSAFAEVEALPAAALWTWSPAPTRSVYWRWPTADEPQTAPQASELRAALERAVTRRLRTDVPTGLLFSSGLDSATVAAIARARTELPAFTLGFADPRYDESTQARAHARRLDLDLEVLPVADDELAARLPETIRALEFAPINAHCVARYSLAQHVRARGIKVVLTGEGSDELFAGYPFFLAEARWRQARSTPSPARGGVGDGLLDDLLERAEHSPLAWASFFEQRARRFDAVPDRLFEPRWVHERPPSRHLLAAITGREGEPPLSVSRQLALLQLQDYLIPALGDRVEMAHGLESRPVFLEREIIELAARCDEATLLDLDGQRTKQLLREASIGLLPAQIREVPKHPFLAPSWRRVLDNPPGRALIARYLERGAVAEFGLFRPTVLAFTRQRWEQLTPDQAAGHRYDWLIGLALGVHILMDVFDLR